MGLHNTDYTYQHKKTDRNTIVFNTAFKDIPTVGVWYLSIQVNKLVGGLQLTILPVNSRI
jgi:hypothetical protein